MKGLLLSFPDSSESLPLLERILELRGQRGISTRTHSLSLQSLGVDFGQLAV